MSINIPPLQNIAQFLASTSSPLPCQPPIHYHTECLRSAPRKLTSMEWA